MSSEAGEERRGEKRPRATECPVCFEPVAQSGEHRQCVLQCGHLFGRSCLERWLDSKKECPVCKKKQKKTNIVDIYGAGTLLVTDTSELNAAVQQARVERERTRQAEAQRIRDAIELSRVRVELEMSKKELARVRAANSSTVNNNNNSSGVSGSDISGSGSGNGGGSSGGGSSGGSGSGNGNGSGSGSVGGSGVSGSGSGSSSGGASSASRGSAVVANPYATRTQTQPSSSARSGGNANANQGSTEPSRSYPQAFVRGASEGTAAAAAAAAAGTPPMAQRANSAGASPATPGTTSALAATTATPPSPRTPTGAGSSSTASLANPISRSAGLSAVPNPYRNNTTSSAPNRSSRATLAIARSPNGNDLVAATPRTSSRCCSCVELLRLPLKDGRIVAFGRRSDGGMILLASCSQPSAAAAAAAGEDLAGGGFRGRGGEGQRNGGSDAANFRHGVTMLSLDDMRSRAFLPLHSQHVRDVCCQLPADSEDGYGGGYGKGYVASTSFDRTLCIVDPVRRNVAVRYELPSPGWSCAWGAEEYSVLCGMSNGAVRIFDLRHTQGSVRLNLMAGQTGDTKPIHTLLREPNGGVLAASLGGCWRWDDPVHHPNSGRRVPLPSSLSGPASITALHDEVAAQEEEELFAASAASEGNEVIDVTTQSQEDTVYGETTAPAASPFLAAAAAGQRPSFQSLLISTRGDTAEHVFFRSEGSDPWWDEKNAKAEFVGHVSRQRLTRAAAGLDDDGDGVWMASGHEAQNRPVLWHTSLKSGSSPSPRSTSSPISALNSPIGSPQRMPQLMQQSVGSSSTTPPRLVQQSQLQQPTAQVPGAAPSTPRSAGSLHSGVQQQEQPNIRASAPNTPTHARERVASTTRATAASPGLRAASSPQDPWRSPTRLVRAQFRLRPCLQLPAQASPVLGVVACWQPQPRGERQRLLAAVSGTELALYQLRVRSGGGHTI